jgi:hypothetical protein
LLIVERSTNGEGESAEVFNRVRGFSCPRAHHRKHVRIVQRRAPWVVVRFDVAAASLSVSRRIKPALLPPRWARSNAQAELRLGPGSATTYRMAWVAQTPMHRGLRSNPQRCRRCACAGGRAKHILSGEIHHETTSCFCVSSCSDSGAGGGSGTSDIVGRSTQASNRFRARRCALGALVRPERRRQLLGRRKDIGHGTGARTGIGGAASPEEVGRASCSGIGTAGAGAHSRRVVVRRPSLSSRSRNGFHSD